PRHHHRATRRARGHRGRVHAVGERRHAAAHARRGGRRRRAPPRLHPRGGRERERPDQPACRGAGLGILRARGGAKTAGRLESSDGKDALARPAPFRPGPASGTRFLSISVISMRRFFFRPSGVSFSATGWYSARPEAIMRSGGMPTSCRKCTTLVARATDSSQLEGKTFCATLLIGTLSVWPTTRMTLSS